ncbi:MAG: 50S ribosomal protein L28 [Chloroflexota bacterium]|nr:50S ribosomal protein L28 [Chloroflexota bacterium]MDE2686575.1 50S ribosomal protein L28 [Chloroflexota bacterium]MYC06412.1 50S ribosomal protein L28 [Chloroflexota bacterium]
MAESKVCEKVCRKLAGQSGNNVSHSKRRTRRRWRANLQKATIQVDGKTKRMKLCTRCLRTHYKQLMKG